MADRRDSEKIRLIRILKKRAKRSRSNLYDLLSRKDEFYGKAIRSQRCAGLMTLICGILGFLFSFAYTIYSNIISGISVNIVSYVIIAVIILSLIIPISLRTSSLIVTPTTMLVLTIIQLIITLLLFGGIIPLVATIFNIVALVRWSTYRNWYDEISVAYFKGEKTVKSKPHKVHKLNDIYDFSSDDEEYDEWKKPVGLIVSLIFAIVLGVGGCIGCFYWGRNGGWIDGYATGKNDGINEGYQNGYDDGRRTGYTWFDMNERYKAGYNDGYRKAGCVIYGINCN